MPVNVVEKNIKSKIKNKEKVVVIENIKYPHFESSDHKKLCSRMNGFYLSVAQKLSYHARKRLAGRVRLNHAVCRLPMTITMNYTISLATEKIISVVLDLAFTEGKNIKSRRFSQIWSIEHKNIVPPSQIIKTDRKSRKKICSLVIPVAKQNGENPAFGYFDGFLAKLQKKIEPANCFAVPRGVCFFINAGVLSPEKYGACNFVLPYSKLEDVIKGDFLPKNDEKDGQTADIVNNV